MSEDLADVAKATGLVYVTDEDEPGWQRERRGRGFSYVVPDGKVADEKERHRIETLAIPPAWTDVWIAIDPDAHIQATGQDDADRKQYRYHDKWRVVRDAVEKFERLAAFGARLPAVRQEVDGYLDDRGLSRNRVLAAATALLDQTLIRIGNEEYAADNDTFGVTTLRPEHVVETGRTLTLRFDGKGGVDWEVPVTDARLRAVIRACLEGDHDNLFWYEVDGSVQDVTSDAVNEFLDEVAGQDFSAKDFRTWGGTRCVTGQLGPLAVAEDEDQVDQDELAAIDLAAQLLGNTRTVARTCYIAPQVPLSWRAGELAELWRSSRDAENLSRPERVTAKVLAEEV